jgi:hypothetical protein
MQFSFIGPSEDRKNRKDNRNRRFLKAASESERIKKMLRHCESYLLVHESYALLRIKQRQPFQWEEQFKDIVDLEGVRTIIKEEIAAHETASQRTAQDEAKGQLHGELHSLEQQLPQLPVAEGGIVESKSVEAESVTAGLSLSDEGLVLLPSEIAVSAGSLTKKLLSIRISVDLLERVKNAVYHSPDLTLSDLGELAFRLAVEHLEKNRGGPFPQRTREIKRGRPIK